MKAHDRYKDHPRGCGEHLLNIGSSKINEGSSPRMRGAQIAKEIPNSDERIIPADAGSTHGCEVDGTENTDHPRGCGEHTRHVHLYQIA